MAASQQDKIVDTRNAARPNSARATGTRSAGGTSLACDNLAGWPTASKVHFVTYQLNSSSAQVAGTQLDCSGIVTGNTIGSITVIDGTDTGNSVNDVVEMIPTAAWGQDLADALTNQHSRTGTHTVITATSLTTTGNSTIGGNETVAGTLGVTGATTISGAATLSGGATIQGNKPWQYLNSATYTGGTVTSTGATPTLITNLTVGVTIPTGVTAVRVTVDTYNLYPQTGSAVCSLSIYSGATSGALTNQIGGIAANSAPTVTAYNSLGHATTLILAPSAGAVYYSAAISAAASNARIDSGVATPAFIVVECC